MTTATNPYITPQGELLSDSQQAYGEVRFFSPACRIGRARYLARAVLLMLAFAGVLGVMFTFSFTRAADGEMGAFAIIAFVLTYLAYMICLWILNIQRCHDLNKSGWFSLLLLVPVANMFVALYMLFAPGTAGKNSYGNRPPPNSKSLIALAVVVPLLLFVGGIVAAIAIPAYQDYTARAIDGAVR